MKGDLSAKLEYAYWRNPAHQRIQLRCPCVDSENRFYITAGRASNVSYIFDGTASRLVELRGQRYQPKQMGGNNYLDGVLYSAFIGKFLEKRRSSFNRKIRRRQAGFELEHPRRDLLRLVNA